jgi:hypothetical protein
MIARLVKALVKLLVAQKDTARCRECGEVGQKAHMLQNPYGSFCDEKEFDKFRSSMQLW